MIAYVYKVEGIANIYSNILKCLDSLKVKIN